MPHFRFRAIEAEAVQRLSKPLVDALEELMQSPRPHFTIEHIPAAFFFEGEATAAYPFVEVLYFDRGQQVQDEIARRVTQIVRDAMGKPEQDVAVIFTKLNPSDYYDNGSHYG
ncbi:DUF1904 domain-containing protein [Shewanella submarina]|uniref:DUF1904 domain-containing protein n=1 Tax=Shewanella submarina TaxID=2016376 RepID=A0ABV7G7W9_9GAMM|nr:DUF1904 domain-containing protein [Shewanella submarina]MCL1037000.1 DUF1904 domain-containing protein [Shewanella submarina]